MPKTKAHAISLSAGRFAIRRSQADELAEIRKYTDYLKHHPEQARDLLVKAGIYTRSGKLAKAYGG